MIEYKEVMADAPTKKMPIIMSLIGMLLVVVACVGIYFLIFHRANPSLKQDQIKIGDAVFSVEVASTTVQEARGLSFRESLPDGQGMLFLFSKPTVQNFWMKDMNFPLDMIWIGGDTVLGFTENALPQPGAPLWSLKLYNSPDGTDKVLEVNAGIVAKHHIKVGDKAQFGI